VLRRWLETAGTGSGDGGASADVGKNGSTADAGVSDDTGSLADSCPDVPCLGSTASLIASCVTSWTCSEQIAQLGTPSARTNLCYDNGIKVSWGVDPTVTSLSQGTRKIVKKGASVCYSVSIIKDASATDASAGNETVTITDGTGALLLTVAYGGNGASKFTCPEGNATALDSTCWGVYDVVYAGILPPAD